MEKIFDDYRGVILFYIIVAVLSLLFTIRINNLNKIGSIESTKTVEHYYA